MKLAYSDFKDYLSRVSKLYRLTSSLIKYYTSVIKQAGENMNYQKT